MLDELLAKLSQTNAGRMADGMLAPHQDTFARSAQRTRQSVMPEGGRREGWATKLPEQMVMDVLSLPRRAMQSAAQYSATGEYNPAPFADTALTAMTGGMPFAAKGAAGIFGGRLAATADKTALVKAEDMAAKGATREQIWNETGWFQGTDKKWRFEIDDSASTLKGENVRDLIQRRGNTVEDVFFHPDLHTAYPKLAKTEVDTGLLPGNAAASYSRAIDADDTARIMLNDYNKSDKRSSLLHELQHGVQGEEGFAIGGHSFSLIPGTPAWDIYKERLKAISTPLSHEVFSKAANYDGLAPMKDYKNYLKITKNPPQHVITAAQEYAAQSAYKRLAGEVEARNVQTRMNMTSDERRASPPWLGEDMNADRQILRFRE